MHRDHQWKSIPFPEDKPVIDLEIWFFEEENDFNCEIGTFGFSIGKWREESCRYAEGGYDRPEQAEAAAVEYAKNNIV